MTMASKASTLQAEIDTLARARSTKRPSCATGRWGLLKGQNSQSEPHKGLQQLVGDLNRLYRDAPSLHRNGFDHNGFEWIDCHDSTQSSIELPALRWRGLPYHVVLNFTPVVRRNYRIGVPAPAGTAGIQLRLLLLRWQRREQWRGAICSQPVSGWGATTPST